MLDVSLRIYLLIVGCKMDSVLRQMKKQEERQKLHLEKTSKKRRFVLNRYIYEATVAYIFRYLWGDKLYDLEEE